MGAVEPTERASGVRIGEWVAGRYRIEQRLGSGGMGTVWLARHGQLGFRVAIKAAWPELLQTQRGASRLRREAVACARVDSPYVVRLLDRGETERGLPCLVFEYLRGPTLAERIVRRGPLPQAALLRLAEQLCAAVFSVHLRGIVHRDLKPDNVLLWSFDGNEDTLTFRVKLLDFGIAKLPEDTSSTQPPSEAQPARVGTPQFMSPEQLRDGAEASAVSDRWMFALTLFVAATGVMPFHGESIEALTRAVCEAPLPLPSAHNPLLPKAVDAWFARACAREPAARYASLESMVRALREALSCADVAQGA